MHLIVHSITQENGYLIMYYFTMQKFFKSPIVLSGTAYIAFWSSYNNLKSVFLIVFVFYQKKIHSLAKLAKTQKQANRSKILHKSLIFSAVGDFRWYFIRAFICRIFSSIQWNRSCLRGMTGSCENLQFKKNFSNNFYSMKTCWSRCYILK